MRYGNKIFINRPCISHGPPPVELLRWSQRCRGVQSSAESEMNRAQHLMGIARRVSCCGIPLEHGGFNEKIIGKPLENGGLPSG